MPAGEHVLEDRENFNIGHRLFYIVCGTCRKFEKVVLRKPLPAGNMRSNFAWRKNPIIKTCSIGKNCTEIIIATKKVN